MKVIAGMIVRGEGSTLKGKNTYPIFGEPMLWWALEAARKCDWIDEIWVWTDDQKSKDIAVRCGCHVIDRGRDQLYYHGGMTNPIEWKAEREQAIIETIGTLGDIRVSLNCNLCLITPEILYGMYVKLMEDPLAGEVVPVCKVEPHLFTVNPKNGKLFPVFSQFGLDRQSYPPLYRAGGVQITHAGRYERMVSLQTAYYEVDPKFLLDVHSDEDARLAEFYLRERKHRCKD